MNWQFVATLKACLWWREPEVYGLVRISRDVMSCLSLGSQGLGTSDPPLREMPRRGKMVLVPGIVGIPGR